MSRWARSPVKSSNAAAPSLAELSRAIGTDTLLARDTVGSAKAALIVTHTGHILSEVPADHGHVLVRGQIVCRGEPRTLFTDIRVHGYEGCLKCLRCSSTLTRPPLEPAPHAQRESQG